MEDRFFSQSEIKNYVEKTVLDGTLGNEKLGIGSSGDILYTAEQMQKGKLNVSRENFRNRILNIIKLEEQGSVCFINLDKELLLDNLFTEDNIIWEGCNEKDKDGNSIPPEITICRLSLKINDCSYWNENTYSEMNAYHEEIIKLNGRD